MFNGISESGLCNQLNFLVLLAQVSYSAEGIQLSENIRKARKSRKSIIHFKMTATIHKIKKNNLIEILRL